MEEITLKSALGFGEQGYITIFKGDTDFYTDWFQNSGLKYAVRWGWYVPEGAEVPSPLPVGIEPIKLDWERVSWDEDTLLPDGKLKEVLNSLIYDKHGSEYIGAIGDKYTGELTVIKTAPYETPYGTTTVHVFEDSLGNQLTWNTTSKQLELGHSYLISGTIKDHSNFKNIHQTVLTRCKVEELECVKENTEESIVTQVD